VAFEYTFPSRGQTGMRISRNWCFPACSEPVLIPLSSPFKFLSSSSVLFFDAFFRFYPLLSAISPPKYHYVRLFFHRYYPFAVLFVDLWPPCRHLFSFPEPHAPYFFPLFQIVTFCIRHPGLARLPLDLSCPRHEMSSVMLHLGCRRYFSQTRTPFTCL